MGDRAPVALFIYARPEHTARTLRALAANDGASETDLVVFADGPRGAEDAAKVEAARRVAREASGFRSVEMVERRENLGLARNITLGVSRVMDRAGRAIVVEDDIETARGFLDFMNAALNRYRDEPRVWHISGWNYPIDPEGLPEFFFWQVMNCWGWASWADRWAHYECDPQRLVEEWSAERRRAFNLDGAHDFFGQVTNNMNGRMKTWAIFWYATIFEHGGLCLNPTRSFTRNVGLDGSGEHCGRQSDQLLEIEQRFLGELPDAIKSYPDAVSRIMHHLRRGWLRQLAGRVRQLLHRTGLV